MHFPFLSFLMRKTCFRCKRRLSVSSFQRDATASGGFKASCKECLNTQRRAAKGKPYNLYDDTPTAKIEKPRKKVRRIEMEATELAEKINNSLDANFAQQMSIAPAPEDMTALLLDELLTKYNCYHTISIAKDGRCHIQIHGEKKRHFRAENIRAALEKAVA